MNNELAIALIGLFGSLLVAGLSLFGVIYSSGKTADKVALQVQNELKTHQAVTDEKIKELTREVREHNNFAQKIPLLEVRIERLEKFHPIRPAMQEE